MNGRQWLSLLFRLLIAIVASSVTSVAASRAFAQAGAVTSLGVRSLDGESQLERKVSQALRTALKNSDSFRLSDRDVSLAQMSLAHGCEEVDAPCLKDIAETLTVDRLIYGSMVRSGDKVRISLFNFSASAGQVEATAERTVQIAQLVDPTLAELMTALSDKLAGKHSDAVGTLRVTGNRPGSSVAVDGKPAGKLNASGELVLPQVSEGTHSVSVVTSDGRDRRELSADVRADTTTTVRALLTPPLPAIDNEALNERNMASEPEPQQPRRNWRKIVGWTSVALATGFAAATIYSWVRIGNIADSEALDAYRQQYAKPGQPGGTDDACREALNRTLVMQKPGNVMAPILEEPARDLCSEAQTLEKLQWVFLSGTVVFGGLGTWLLITAPKEPSTTLSIRPSFSPMTASLKASLSF